MLIVVFLLQCANGKGFFELQVLEIANYRGELQSGACCGTGGPNTPKPLAGGKCPGQCSTFFRVCLKEYQNNITSAGPCSFGNTSSQVLGGNTFTLADPDRGKLVLPFTFRWTVSLISHILLSSQHKNIKTLTLTHSRRTN